MKTDYIRPAGKRKEAEEAIYKHGDQDSYSGSRAWHPS